MDYNLSEEVGSLDMDLEWKFLFREAASIIWFWRNAHIFGIDKDIPNTHQLVWEATSRVREWKIAWQNHLLRKL